MKYILLVFTLFGCNTFLLAQKKIKIDSEELVWIGKNISIFEDYDGKLGIKDILKKDSKGSFQVHKSRVLYKPISSSAYWIKFTVSNSSKKDIWLALERNLIVSLDFYAPDEKGIYSKVVQTGALSPYKSRPYPIINGFWLPLDEAHDTQSKTYYLRITAHFGLDIPLQIATLPKLHQQKTTVDILSAAFIGLMVIMILYNSFLFFSTKDNIYLLYTGYLISITFIATFLNSYPIIEYFTGYQIQFFWHDYFSIWAYPVIICSALFCIKYLNLKTNLPKAAVTIKWIVLSQLIIIFINLTGLTSIAILSILEQIVPITLYSTCLFAAIYLYFFKKLKQARFYLLGWSFFFVGLILLVLSGNGFIPFNIYVRNASYFGIALEVWMFSLALGDRMNLLRKESEKTQNKLLTLANEQNDTLEKAIQKRTKQLEEKQKILEEQNEKLKANSGVLKKSHAKLKKTLEENKVHLEQIEKQKSEIEESNQQLKVNQDILYKNRNKLKDTLEKNKVYLEQIKEQKEELQGNNEELEAKENILKQNLKKLQAQQAVLQKSRNKLKNTLEKNKVYLKQIEEQKATLQNNNQELQAKEEELRQNFEELQSTQEVLEIQQKRLKISLAENQSITQALNQSAIVSITDLKGNILQVNEIFCNLSGYTEEELIGKNQSIVNSGYHPKLFWKNMWKTIEMGDTWRGEIRNQSKEGSHYWVDAVINPMYDVDGKIYRYLSIRYLITKRKEAEERIKLQNSSILRKNRKIAKTIDTISRLSKEKNFLNGDWYLIAQDAVKAGVEVLKVDTCQVWYYNYKEEQMSCFTHESQSEEILPQSISQEENPLFFKVLEDTNLLKINDIDNSKKLSKADKKYFIDKGFKSFILYPLFLSKKQRGILAVFHKKVYAWESEDIIFLKSVNDEFNFAYQAFKREQAKEKIKEQNKQIIEINESITESVAYAHNIQTSILPNPKEIQQYLPESFIYFNPRDAVSGDFYFFAQKEYKMIIAAVDCTGHGIPGAFMSIIGNSLLSEIVNAKAITKPDKILNMLREGIIKVLKQEENNNQDGMDIAICAIEQYPEEFHKEIGIPHLEYAGAGNPLIYFQDNELFRIKSDKIIIGGFRNYLPDETFTLHRIPLDKPTTFYIFSDGIQDQFGGENRRKFTPRRLRELLQDIHQKSMQEQKSIITKTVDDWQKIGDELQIDDMLIIGVRI